MLHGGSIIEVKSLICDLELENPSCIFEDNLSIFYTSTCKPMILTDDKEQFVDVIFDPIPIKEYVSSFLLRTKMSVLALRHIILTMEIA